MKEIISLKVYIYGKNCTCILIEHSLKTLQIQFLDKL